jgi:hypothetical protein
MSGFLDRKKQLDRVRRRDAKQAIRAANQAARAAERAAMEANRSPTASTEQVSATLAAFKARAAQEAKRSADATDSEFWVALCFHTRDDKEAFLREFALDVYGDKYLDGYKTAEALRRRGADVDAAAPAALTLPPGPGES